MGICMKKIEKSPNTIWKQLQCFYRSYPVTVTPLPLLTVTRALPAFIRRLPAVKNQVTIGNALIKVGNAIIMIGNALER